ncbi:MAG: extracellular solute-binding protein, partial [Oscillospiraceae bacterium]|nr:extracellular solute-binding protein [Oscillospiraceae bacterium]
MKRSLSFVAALLMAVSLGGLAGCGGTKPTPPVLRDEHGRYVTPVHYTTVRPSQTNASMPDGWTLTSNPVVTACVDQLNVSWSVLWEDNNFMPHLLQDLTANTLADVFLIPGNNANTYSTFDTLYQSGALADLTDYYNSDAPQDVKDTYNSYGPSIWQSVTRGGRIYGLPSTNNQYQHELLYVRNDWLQACNLPAPKTIQDIENTALAFIHQNPGGNTPDAPTIG